MSLIINDDNEVAAIRAVLHEIEQQLHRPYPMSHLRRVAIIGEEFGEAMREALDATRGHYDSDRPRSYRKSEVLERLRRELIHTAAVTLRALIEMERESK